VAFARLAGIVGDRNVDTLTGVDPDRAGGDAVWALAENLAGTSGAWFPLVEMARLSIHQDREGALRRLRTAVQRDRTGTALLAGLEMLRAEGHAREAVALGIGHFRPSLHDPKIGRALIAAAVEDGRVTEIRRFLAALGDTEDVADLRAELESLVAQAAQSRAVPHREIDLRGTEVVGFDVER
jgi:hypothetical protein